MRRLAWVACVLLAGCELIDRFPRFSFDAEVVRIATTPDLVGFPTALDGSGSISPDATALRGYEWHFTQVPSGSTIDDRALSSSTAPRPQFEPDLGGDYTVQLVVTSVGGTQARASRTFTVPTLPIFYYEGLGDATAQQLGVGVLRSDGTGRHLLSCSIAPSGPDGGTVVDPLSGLRLAGSWGMRAHYPASGPALVAFLEVAPGGDAGAMSDFRLWSADEASECNDRPPLRIDAVGVTSDHAHLFPRFSPDAIRVAYFDVPPVGSSSAASVVTVSLGRTAQHTVRGSMARLHSAPPVWLDATHVAWVEDVSTTAVPHLVVYAATDQDRGGDAEPPQGTRTTLLDCDGPGGRTGTPVLTRINQLAVLPDGDLVIAGAVHTPFDAQPGSFQLYRMRPGTCATDRVLAPEPPGGFAWDFDVSPDGRTIVFSGGVPPRDLFLVPADGSTAPLRLAGDPGREDVGPRFVAGGRQVFWTQTTDAEPPSGGGIMIANVDGTHVRSLYGEGPVAAAGNVRARVIAGTNLGTSCDYGHGAPVGGGVLAALALLALALRRSRGL